VIGGGEWNFIGTNADHAVIGGGEFNAVGTNASHAVIGGGETNTLGIDADHAVISGGGFNIVETNAAYATIPGGFENEAAGTHSFAAGLRARALHDGAFVWSGGLGVDSTADHQVTFQCPGGARFLSGGPGTNQMVSWNPGDAFWTFSSDRNVKEDFTLVEPVEVLDKVSELPITEWNYKGYDKRHLGPMAQDFHAAFNLGGSETTIDGGDLHGVALAAIQGLHQLVRDKDAAHAAELADMQHRFSEETRMLRKEMEALKNMIR
jgi:hypothetical protein